MKKECKSKGCCRAGSCNKRHHTLLHPPSDTSSDGPRSYQNYRHAAESHNTETSETSNETEVTAHTQSRKSHTFLQVIQVILSNGPLSVETNALLCSRSDTTFLRKDIAKRLKLESSQQQLTATSALLKSDKIDSAIVSVNALS